MSLVESPTAKIPDTVPCPRDFLLSLYPDPQVINEFVQCIQEEHRVAHTCELPEEEALRLLAILKGYPRDLTE